MGLNQSTHGTWNTNAICNLHLATGAICRPGSGPMSLTGQPNAMGGREMGYMGPGLPGQRSVLVGRRPRVRRGPVGAASRARIRQRRRSRHHRHVRADSADGEIKACWIICTNPVATVANRKTVIAGLEAAELVITQDAYRDDRDQPLRRHRAARHAVGRIRRRDGQLRAQPDAVAAVDSGPPVEARPGLAADLPGRRAHGLRGALRLRVQRGDLRRDHAGSGTRRPATTCAVPATSGCGGRRCSGPVRRTTTTAHPIRYLNDGVSQELFVDDERPHAAAGVSDSVAARGVPRPPTHGCPWNCPTTISRWCSNTGRLQHQWHTMTKTGKVDKLNKLDQRPVRRDSSRRRRRARHRRRPDPSS